ncbi:MAG TPA: adenosylcobalamin-dependent ribonucleoside-diphosphate reductase, partial [Steroidobacteraceae bacterium]|nr:adenosylcobalamin-dependent ribonucleoside-diphosphate reductase [Steroidobacteraceae bacterium]
IAGIFRSLEESAVTLQQGGGIGCDFSTLRPRGDSATSAGTIASGPVSFMHVWNAMCATVLASGGRRGAMMATLRCDHPDLLEFIDAKLEPGALHYFNLSVLVTDDFLAAVRSDAAWPLVFPVGASDADDGPATLVSRSWPGREGSVPCRVHRVVPARQLWSRLVTANHASSEPGVLFVDTINRANNLRWLEDLSATNPCGEVPLPPYGACVLGSLNLTRFVRDPCTKRASLDIAALEATVPEGVRFLDAVLDATRYPLPRQGAEARTTRRIGLGITGLADTLAVLGLHYDSDAARDLAGRTMRRIFTVAYSSSADLATEKGAFPAFDRERYLAGDCVRRLPAAVRDSISRQGIRNSHLISIAPAGTISLLAGNVSSGIEPVFQFEGHRTVLSSTGEPVSLETTDWALRRWRECHRNQPLPRHFVTATELSPEAHLRMQAVLQPWVDGAISKTITLPADANAGTCATVFERAHALGVKGCTTYRPGTRRGQVVGLAGASDVASTCCATG